MKKQNNRTEPRLYSRSLDRILELREKIAQKEKYPKSIKKGMRELKRDLEREEENLVKLVMEAPLGQNGACQIRDYSSWEKCLYINGVLRVVLAKYNGWVIRGAWNAGEASRKREAKRKQRRSLEKEYLEERSRLMKDLEETGHREPRSFPGRKVFWEYDLGLFKRANGGISINADKALKAVWGEEYWKRSCHAANRLRLEDEVDRKIHGTKY